MSKTIKTTTSTEKEKKKTWSHFDDYFNTTLYAYVPISEHGLEILGVEFVNWARDDEDALIIEDFFNLRGVPDRALRKWLERSEKFQMIYESGKRYISSRREKGALRRGLAEGMVMRSMPKFDRSWKELEKWRSGLRTKEQAAGKGDIKVIMESFPSTNIVPEKKHGSRESGNSGEKG